MYCIMAAAIATNGPGILVNYVKFLGEFYFGLMCLWLLLILAGFVILGLRVKRLIALVLHCMTAGSLIAHRTAIS